VKLKARHVESFIRSHCSGSAVLREWEKQEVPITAPKKIVGNGEEARLVLKNDRAESTYDLCPLMGLSRPGREARPEREEIKNMYPLAGGKRRRLRYPLPRGGQPRTVERVMEKVGGLRKKGR